METIIKRKRTKLLNHRWTDDEQTTLLEVIIDYMQETLREFEKPTAQQFYDAIFQIYDIPHLSNLGSNVVRNKMRHLKKMYLNAVEWKHKTETGLSREGKHQNIEEYVYKICPNYNLLEQIFNHLKNTLTPDEEFGSFTFVDIDYDVVMDEEEFPEPTSQERNTKKTHKTKNLVSSYVWKSEDCSLLLEAIAERIRDNPASFEKPTTDDFYTSICEEYDLPYANLVGCDAIKSKLRQLKALYINSEEWKQKSAKEFVKEKDEHNIKEYVENICPNHDLLHLIFGNHKSVIYPWVLDSEEKNFSFDDNCKNHEKENRELSASKESLAYTEQASPSFYDDSQTKRIEKHKNLNNLENDLKNIYSSIEILVEIQKKRTKVEEVMLEHQSKIEEQKLKQLTKIEENKLRLRAKIEDEKVKLEREKQKFEIEKQKADIELRKLKLEKEFELKKYELELKYKKRK